MKKIIIIAAIYLSGFFATYLLIKKDLHSFSDGSPREYTVLDRDVALLVASLSWAGFIPASIVYLIDTIPPHYTQEKANW